MIRLDHLAVAGETLEAARAFAEEVLGVAMQPGGEHAVFHTHNALLGLADGLYLEAIAINPDAPAPAPAPDRARWFDLDRFAGPARLTNWICRTENLETALAALPFDLGTPVQLQRGDLRWRMAVPETGILPFDNFAPALIEWQTSPHPAQVLAPSGLRLRRLTLRHPQAEALRAALATHMQDDRISFETGEIRRAAVFDTPQGERILEG